MDDTRADPTYRQFIDEMVVIARRGVRGDRIAAHGHTERANNGSLPLASDEALRKEFCLGLNPSQKVILSQLLLAEREAAVHDVLSYLEWAVQTETLSISGADGSFLGKAEETMHGDFIARSTGDEWQNLSAPV
jgi:hypothetical protein